MLKMTKINRLIRKTFYKTNDKTNIDKTTRFKSFAKYS